MTAVVLLSLAVFLVLFGLIFVATGVLAKRKGYEFWPWFCAGGIIGLVFLSTLPDTNNPGLSEGNRQFLKDKGNRLGWKIAVVSLVLVAFRIITWT